ncbi:alpha/beta-hydrolase [Hymenopellis radicata]|nr:alpha/beta-hydrolase [Hymenopellis radicata]
MTQMATPKYDAQALETYSLKGAIKVVERFFDLPLDYSKPEGETIRVFARSGPGHEVPLADIHGYAAEIHARGYQTLWLDPRGTGLTTRISPESLPARLKTDQDVADYLKLFRADSIVKDCEAIRSILLGHKPNPEDRKWTILGQSFGGFCAITYLSFHSEGLKEVFTTGGLAPLVSNPDPVYAATVRDIMSYLEANEVKVTNGGRLSPNRWQHLGMDFGMHSTSSSCSILHLIERPIELVFRASKDLELLGKLTYKAIQLIESSQSFDGNPIFSILHEPIYCQGQASKWSAFRTLDSYPQFSWSLVKNLADTEPIYFTGEMIFPNMFSDYANMRPLKGAAELLAHYDGWGPLFDLEQLKNNEVKVSSVSYFDDMYVDFDLAQDTAAKIKNTEQYVTNHLVHSGLRANPKDVMGKLFELSKREYD